MLDQMSPGLWDPRCKLVLNIVADCQTCHSQVWVIQCSPGARSGSGESEFGFGYIVWAGMIFPVSLEFRSHSDRYG